MASAPDPAINAKPGVTRRGAIGAILGAGSLVAGAVACAAQDDDIAIHRIDLGYFIRPANESASGSRHAEPCLGYLINHPGGLVLFDTGIGSAPDVDAHYRPHRRSLVDALASVGVRSDDIAVVVNSHLHFDHCAANRELPQCEIVVQAEELRIARTQPDYTLPELINGPGLRYRELSGEAEIQPGVLAIPTPGHTPGHQSLAVSTADGTVILAGQCHDTATAFNDAVMNHRATQDGDRSVPPGPVWLPRLLATNPRRVLFAHDRSAWEP